MAMKSVLIAPEGFKFAYPADEKIITTSKSINEVLIALKDKEGIEVLVIPAEQTISAVTNSDFSGIEIIKHIRLTPELEKINKLPIVLLHWHSIDYYISKNHENIFLYSPSIYRYRLPHSKISFGRFEDLAQNLASYLFGSETDETISDHVFKNEIAIKQFEQQVNNPSVELINKELWFKKTFYKNFGISKMSLPQKVSPIKAHLKILIADDMASKWIPQIKKVITGSKFIQCHTLADLKKVFEVDNMSIPIERVNDIIAATPTAKIQLVKEYIDILFAPVANLILLDINFTETPAIDIEDSDGKVVIDFLQAKDLKIPVIIFSSTTKNINILHNYYDYIIGHYIKSITPLFVFEGFIKTALKLSILSNIANKLNMLILFQGNYYCIKETEITPLPGREKLKINNAIKSIIDKIYLILIWNNNYIKNAQRIYGQFDEIIIQFAIIQDSFYKIKLTPPDSIETRLRSIRNPVIHPHAYSLPNENWRRGKLEEKLEFINDISRRTFAALLFGV